MDLKQIEALIEVVKNARVTEVSVRRDGAAVTVRKSLANHLEAPAAAERQPEETPSLAPEEQAESETGAGLVIRAPMVGIFHMADPVNATGVQVGKGQIVGAIESMKLMNEVVSDVDGTVVELYIESGMPVEYGQALFRLEGA
jgi:acetyl-CoA carboxylase biotin carboxyl carrier protein